MSPLFTRVLLEKDPQRRPSYLSVATFLLAADGDRTRLRRVSMDSDS